MHKLDRDAIECPYTQGMFVCVVDVMKMGNIVPRAESETTSLVFQASVLPLHHICALMLPLYPRPVYVAPCLRGQCSLLHSFPWNCKFLLMLTGIQAYWQ